MIAFPHSGFDIVAAMHCDGFDTAALPAHAVRCVAGLVWTGIRHGTVGISCQSGFIGEIVPGTSGRRAEPCFGSGLVCRSNQDPDSP